MRGLTAAEYLTHARPIPSTARFAVGTYERNITLYRQQMRALNLVHAMADDGLGAAPYAPGTQVAVIGGGAFGLTAAAAAAWVGYEVRLYERHQALLPLQRGCDTRWVNPRYYEWPSPGSESRFAGLPLMNWQAGTASQVADQLEQEFEDIKSSTGRVRAFVGVRNLKCRPFAQDGQERFTMSCRHRDNGRLEQEEWRCDVIVYATGFGIEHDLGSATESYWRNDRFGQLDLKAGSGDLGRYVISGTGDGGLTDAARLKIVNFRHERVFFELFGDAPASLLDALREIRRDWANAAAVRTDWLFGRFESLENHASGDLLRDAKDRLGRRLRRDTWVRLNGRAPAFRDALTLRDTALSNALLAFLLFRLNAFTYVEGELLRQDDRWRYRTPEGKRKLLQGDPHVVVRHGTNRDDALHVAGFGDAVPELKSRSEGTVDTAARIFPPGWWGAHRHGAVTSAAVEFVPPATMLLATTAMSTLADIMVERLLGGPTNVDGRDSSPRFRITMHRVIRLGDKEWFQQITPYKGLLADGQEGGSSRIFPVEAGIVGLAVRTGRAVVFRREQSRFEEMKAKIRFEKLLAQPIQVHVDSIVACPFFYAPDERSGRKVAFVIFADTSEKEFFDDDVLRMMYAACKGFVRNIEEALAEGRIRQVSSEYAGFECQEDLTANQVRELADVGIDVESGVLDRYRDDLTFSTLNSSDLEVSLSRIRERPK